MIAEKNNEVIEKLQELLDRKMKDQCHLIDMKALAPFMPEVAHIEYSSGQTWMPSGDSDAPTCCDD